VRINVRCFSSAVCRYIINVDWVIILLLLRRHKFDLNVYVVMLILPRRLLCFYHDGFLRFGQQVYSPPSSTHAYAASHDDREPAYSTNLAPQQGSAPSFASFDQVSASHFCSCLCASC
jgi:hypothetical protein